MSQIIRAISLTDEERAILATIWSPEEFDEKQREFLRAEIQRAVELSAQREFAAQVAAKVEEAKAAFPTLFPGEVEPQP